MRYLRKRLTVINDGFCKSEIPANKRIDKVIDRYVTKMSKKGWIPHVGVSCGNDFAQYEAYVRMCFPKNKSERELAHSAATDWKFNNETKTYSLKE